MRDKDTKLLEEAYNSIITEGADDLLDMLGNLELLLTSLREEHKHSIVMDEEEDFVSKIESHISTKDVSDLIGSVESVLETANTDEDHEDSLSDIDADADALASAGWGTDEDYGYNGGEDY